MTYDITVTVFLKPGVLDPQGQAIQTSLSHMGQTAVKSVEQGKIFKLVIEADTPEDAHKKAEQAAESLLANTVIESFQVVEVK